MKDPKLALVPWTELAKRDFGDTAVLEAQIAVPYAYAELGAYGQSLESYEGAIAAFERENADLEESIKAHPRRQARSTRWSSRTRATRWAGSGRSATCPTCRARATWRRCWRSTNSRRR